ncbi:transposase [Streptomyces sp. NPDC055006]
MDEPGDTLRGLAVDGKAVRGSRTDADKAVYLLAATLHTLQTVISQRQIAAKSNEIPAFAPLLERIDLRGTVVTADALHTQRAHTHRHRRPLPPGRQGQSEEAPQTTQEAALAGDPAAEPNHGHRPRPPRGPPSEGLHRPARTAVPPRRPGHGDQTPPY